MGDRLTRDKRIDRNKRKKESKKKDRKKDLKAKNKAEVLTSASLSSQHMTVDRILKHTNTVTAIFHKGAINSLWIQERP